MGALIKKLSWHVVSWYVSMQAKDVRISRTRPSSRPYLSIPNGSPTGFLNFQFSNQINPSLISHCSQAAYQPVIFYHPILPAHWQILCYSFRFFPWFPLQVLFGPFLSLFFGLLCFISPFWFFIQFSIFFLQFSLLYWFIQPRLLLRVLFFLVY